MLDRPALFIAGIAGAGKSTLSGAFSGWLGDQGMHNIVINMDPGADQLPYKPDIDIREWVRLDEIMSDLGLGPNGAQIAAADLIAVNLHEIEQAASEFKPDLYIVDTPGQLELFAFRASGPFVAATLSSQPMLAFLLDPVVAHRPRGLISQLLLSATVHFRMQVPTINVMSKMDMLAPDDHERLGRWLTDHDELLDALDEAPSALDLELNRSIAHTIQDFSAMARTIMASADTGEGFEEIYEVLTNTYAAGEKEMPG